MESISAWQCIGCGNLEAPQTCIGVCEYRKVELVDARSARRLNEELEACHRFLRRLVQTHPRSGQFERSFDAVQQEARRLLAEREPRN